MLEGYRKAHENLDKAVKDVLQALWRQFRVGKSGDDTLTAYSKRHAKRRSEIGLPTSPKDFDYSGSMLSSLTETERIEDPEGVTAVITFDGTPLRRADQKRGHAGEPKTTRDVADLLSEQQLKGKSIIKLSTINKDEIQKKWGVIIND